MPPAPPRLEARCNTRRIPFVIADVISLPVRKGIPCYLGILN